MRFISYGMFQKKEEIYKLWLHTVYLYIQKYIGKLVSDLRLLLS